MEISFTLILLTDSLMEKLKIDHLVSHPLKETSNRVSALSVEQGIINELVSQVQNLIPQAFQSTNHQQFSSVT